MPLWVSYFIMLLKPSAVSYEHFVPIQSYFSLNLGWSNCAKNFFNVQKAIFHHFLGNLPHACLLSYSLVEFGKLQIA